QLEAKVRHALALQAARDRADVLARQVLLTNQQLEATLDSRVADLRKTHEALLFAIGRLAASRDDETANHQRRLQKYVRLLSEEAFREPSWSGLINERFLEQLDAC